MLILAVACQSDRGDDLLILRDGTMKQGRLDVCAAQACTFNGSSIPRASIQFIGFHGVKPLPPVVRDRLQDEVHRIDKSVHPGPLRSVDGANVVAASTHPRGQVAWIYLAPAGLPPSVPPVGQRSPGAQSAGDSDCGRREVLLYDVVVTGKKSGHATLLPKFDSDGEFAFSYAYSVRYPGVPVTLEHQCVTGDIKIRGPAGIDEVHAGSAILTNYVWRDSIVRRKRNNPGESSNTKVPCGFNASTAGLAAQIRVDGYAGSGSGRRPWLRVYSRLRPGDGTLDALLQSRRAAACDKGFFPNTTLFDNLSGGPTVPIYNEPVPVDGVNLHPPRLHFLGQFSEDDNSVGVPEPLRALIRGESFSVSSGQRTYEGTGGSSTVRATTSVTVTFNRAR